MKLRDWLKGLDYEVIRGDVDAEVEDVTYDSRKAKAGDVFVCMRGTRVDSHLFISQVVDAGVKVLVIEREPQELLAPLKGDVTVIKVADGRRALALLSAARFGHPAKKLVTIGVTGTKGKTTTTHMIKAILEAAGKKVGMIGTIGTMIGDQITHNQNTTPESYQLHKAFAKMVEAGCEYMVMEVSSQGVKMHRTDGIFFDYGIFTNISPDHIGPDEHADFEEYLHYKARLLSMCKVGLVNRDDEHFDAITANADCDLYTYTVQSGETCPPANFAAKNIGYVSEHDFVGSQFTVEGHLNLQTRLGMPGLFNVENALAAVSLCRLLGISPAVMAQALEGIRVNGRMEIVHRSKDLTVLVDYAHNAISMESLLATLRDYHPKRLVCVFGCGGNRSKDRRYSMGEIGGKMADFCILTADNSRYEKTEDILADIRSSIEKTGGKFLEIADREQAIRYSIEHAQPGDMVAVIGKGHEDYQEICGVRHHFLDREVIERVLGELEEKV